MNNEQYELDNLYNQMSAQKLRCDYFFKKNHNMNSVWNKYTDEKFLFDIHCDNYKNWYLAKINQLKTKIFEYKEKNITSYLTLNVNFYIQQYTEWINDIDTYTVRIEQIDNNTLITENLSHYTMNTELINLFPNFLLLPTLFKTEC